MTDLKDFKALADSIREQYFNTIISDVNDHVVRMSIMTDSYPWHYHPNSDETFIGVEGTVIVETENSLFELTPGCCITIPRNVVHKTRPKEKRSVNLTVESRNMETVNVNPEQG